MSAAGPVGGPEADTTPMRGLAVCVAAGADWRDQALLVIRQRCVQGLR